MSEPAASLRILMVSARYAPFVGGTEIHTGEVAAGLAKRGHQVTVLTTDTDGTLPAYQHEGDVVVRRVRAYPKRGDLYYAPDLRDVIETEEWDIVHIQGYHTAVAPIALAAAAKTDAAVALTFHSGGHSSSLRNMLRPLQVRYLRRFLGDAELLIGVSQFEADLFADRLDLPSERITVIPNGVSAPERLPAADSAGTEPAATDPSGEPDAPVTILSMGRLVRYKGHQRVIKAMPKVLESFPDAKLLVLGEGPYQRSLERLIQRLRLTESVSLDYVPSDQRERLHELMSNASLAVLMSSYESHGMAAHEALAAGLPLVVMDSTALSEIVGEGHAEAVPPNATQREVAAIVTRTLRKGREDAAGRPDAYRAHTWSTIVDRVEAEYLRVLGRNRTV